MSLGSEPETLDDEYVLTCKACGYRKKYIRNPLYMILGTSGSGKSTLCQRLVGKMEDYLVIEVDMIWSDDYNEPETDFIRFKQKCLSVANYLQQNGQKVVFFLQGNPEEYNNLPQVKYFNEIKFLFLLSDEDTIIRNLGSRPGSRRMADDNPESKEHLAAIVGYNAWLKEYAEKHNIPAIQTSRQNLQESTDSIIEWLENN